LRFLHHRSILGVGLRMSLRLWAKPLRCSMLPMFTGRLRQRFLPRRRLVLFLLFSMAFR